VKRHASRALIISWLMVSCGIGCLVLAMCVGPMKGFWDAHLELMIPYTFLAASLFFVQTNRSARWAAGVSCMITIVTVITAYELPREFWKYLSVWVNYITVGQSVVAAAFLFHAFRHHRRASAAMARESESQR
jgi:hypothetical protein